MKTRKKKSRSMKSYAMGSGNTGVIKGYYEDANEEFREDAINVKKAQAEAASNPWVMGLNALGSITTQVGMSIMSSSGSPVASGVAKGMTSGEQINAVNPAVGQIAADKGIDIKTGNSLEQNPFLLDRSGAPYADNNFALGTGKKGVGSTVEAEAGEIIETPEGEIAELGGKKHSEGGEDINVPEGTRIFSDQLKIAGKTMAERKKSRVNKMNKVMKMFETDPTDMVSKETVARTQAKHKYEEDMDLQLQGLANGLDELHNAALGTDSSGTYANGTGWAGIKKGAVDFGKGFTGGDLAGIFGNLYQGFSAQKSARENAANDTVNPNFFAGIEDESIAEIDKASSILSGMQGQAERKVAQNRTKQIDAARQGRGYAQNKAFEQGAFVDFNKGITDVYLGFASEMMKNIMSKSDMRLKGNVLDAQGATAADIANRMDADNAATQMGVANETMGRAIQMTGKDLNINKRSRVLDNLQANLSKYGLSIDKDGNLTKTT